MKELPRKTLTGFKSDVRAEENTIIADKLPNPSRRIEIEIGDAKQADFYPQFKTKHWDNEANFSVRLREDDYEADDIKIDNGRVEWKKGIKTARLYELDGFEDGGFEFEVEFAEKPESNVVKFTIQTKELNFFYQPSLTEQEIAEGAERPENVIGSYAVYHKSKRDNRVRGKEYRTGKAFHIYRPFAEDVEGKRAWCELNIDEEAGILSVTVPETFLNEAMYPVRVDPTFGYESIGGTTQDGNVMIGRTATSGSDAGGANLDSIHVYGRAVTGSGHIAAALYGTNTLLTPHSATVNVTTSAGWRIVDMSAYSLAASTPYNLITWADAAAYSHRYYYDTQTNVSRIDATGLPTWPNWADGSVTFSTTVDNGYSIYATYTAPPSEEEADDEQDAELHGIDTADSARDAVMEGQASANISRAVELHGEAQTSSARDAEATGSASTSSSRQLEIQVDGGEASARDAETWGTVQLVGDRDGELTGSLHTQDLRAAQLIGFAAVQGSRDGELSGQDIASAIRATETHGEIVLAAARTTQVIGLQSAVSARSAEATGEAIATTSRTAQATGALAANATRAAELFGAIVIASVRNAEILTKPRRPYTRKPASPYSTNPSPYRVL